MLVDRTHSPWLRASALLAAASAVAYFFYALRAPNGPTGGSLPGLLFGFAGTAVIVFECLLSLRKRYPASPFGRVQTWLRSRYRRAPRCSQRSARLTRTRWASRLCSMTRGAWWAS